jgi:TonB family protein
MITKLLLGGSMLLLFSCSRTPDQHSTGPLSDDEMKDLVEVEEIEFGDEEFASRLPAAVKDVLFKDSLTSEILLEKSITSSIGEMEDEIIIDRIYEPVKIKQVPPEPPVPPHGGKSRDTLECGAYLWPDVPAEFPGGIAEMRKFISSNIIYPRGVCDVRGRVYVSFEVEKDGCITHAKIMRGIAEDLDQEALRLVRSMPQWIPAENNGKIVAAHVRLPISFELN